MRKVGPDRIDVLEADAEAEEPGRPLIATLTNALQSKRALLVLDNCEHLVDACVALVDRLLRAAPQLRILASSRQALGILGEVVWPVSGLAAPVAAELFVERAALVRPGFAATEQNAPAIAEICRQLDGLPLAIELAAARTKVLAPEQIASRLSDRFRLLTTGNPTASLPTPKSS